MIALSPEDRPQIEHGRERVGQEDREDDDQQDRQNRQAVDRQQRAGSVCGADRPASSAAGRFESGGFQ